MSSGDVTSNSTSASASASISSASSAITEVFKSLASARPKLLSHLSHDSSSRFESSSFGSNSTSIQSNLADCAVHGTKVHESNSSNNNKDCSSSSVGGGDNCNCNCNSNSCCDSDIDNNNLLPQVTSPATSSASAPTLQPSHQQAHSSSPHLQSHPTTSAQPHAYAHGAMEGRGPRVTFGLESLHRASQALSSSLDSSNDTHGHPPDYNALLRGLDKDNCTSVASAVEDCETAARWIRRCWNTEQALGLWNVANWLVREPGSTAEAVEGRKAAASLLKNLADRHDVSYDAREKLLASIATDVPPEALPELVDPLQAITEHGRKIDFVDVPLLPVITSWIVPLYEVTASYRSRLRRGQKPPYVVNEEALRVLFEFTETIVTLLCKPPSLEYAEALFNQIFVVCRRTGVVADIKQALSVFDSFIGIPCIPDGSFVTLIEVLCSIQAAIKNLAGSTSRTVRNLAKSGKSTEMVSTLFAFIRETGENERPLHIIRGAVNFLSDLLVTYGQDRTPEMDYDTLITTLECATLRNDSKIDASVLEVCLDMLRSSYVDVVLTHNISGLIEVIVQCSHKPSDQPPRSPATPDSQSSLTRCFHGDDTRYNVSAVMTRIIETFETLWPRLSQEQRGNVTVLFISAHSYLNDSQNRLLQEWYRDNKICFPENPEWTMHCKRLIKDFILARDKVPVVRLQAVETLSEVYSTGTAADVFDDEETVKSLVAVLSQERNQTFMERFIPFLVDLAINATDDNFDRLITALSQTMPGEERSESIPGADTQTSKATATSVAGASSSSTTPSAAAAAASAAAAQAAGATSLRTPVSMEQTENSMTNIATIGLVRIFLRALDTAKESLNAAGRASMVFEKLIDVSLSSSHPTDARLTALKLLFRIRCDSSGALYVIHATENDFLVSVLTRTSDRTSDIMMSRANSVDDLIKSSQSEEGGVTHSSSNKPLKDPSSLPLSTTATTTTTTTVTTGNRTTFSASHQQTARRWRPPVWTYLEPTGLPEEPPEGISELALAFELPTSSNSDGDGGSDDGGSGSRRRVIVFKLNLWLEAIIMLLQRERDWDIYSYVLAHLGPQLMNRHLMQYSAVPQIKLLRSVLCEQIKNESFLEPFSGTGVKKADVAICIYDSLTMMICFHEHFAKSEQDELVRCFMLGIGSWEGTSRGCIHALSICCHEIPRSVTRMLIAILDKMAKIITQHHNAVHILEFLALLARLPEVFTHLREEEIRPVFGICIRFIQSSREKRLKAAAEERNAAAAAAAAASGSKSSSKDEVPTVTSAAMSSTATSLSISKDLSRYVYILAYHVMIFWFLSLKLQDRVNHVSWITRSLIFTDAHGKDVVEEQSQVLIDMMQRATFSDLGETIPFEKFPPNESDGPVTRKSWVVGMSIVTVEVAGATGLAQIIKRQASGTTYAMYQQRTAPTLPHQIPATGDSHLIPEDDASRRSSILPGHILLQLMTTAMPVPMIMQPVPLPDDDATNRAIRTFDRNDIVDGHKIGVVYVGEGQTTEAEILRNDHGSPDYEFFLRGLGTKVALKDAKFNTQGLHSDFDGEYTYAWRDRTTEVVYHVATMMPTNLETDPQCINKKRHLGNDFVNVIYNRSNQPYNFHTIASQFNFVNIVISPVSRISSAEKAEIDGHENEATPAEEASSASGDHTFDDWYFVVKVMTKADFPELSAAAVPKVIAAKNLPAFVRLIALNATFYSSVSSSHGGEHISPWRNRLREIKRLRGRALAQQAAESGSSSESTYPSSSYRRGGPSGVAAAVAKSAGEINAQQVQEYNPDVTEEWSPQTDTTTLSGLDFSRWCR